MAIKKSKNIKNTTSDGFAYLTKRTIVARARAAGKMAADNAMEIMGHVVIAENGWIVKKFKDGHVERLSQLQA
jgi:hypothetical protein